MCKIENGWGYLSTLCKKTTHIQLLQPKIKNKPPMGVMGPKKAVHEFEKMDAKANKYKEPLKQNMPAIKKLEAQPSPFCAPLMI